MTVANFTAARIEEAARSRLNEIQRGSEPRSEETQRVEHMLAFAQAIPANEAISLSIDDFVLLQKYLKGKG